MLFVGHTRFSLFEPQSRKWRLTRATGQKALAQYKERLFSEDRLQLRTELFLEKSLPLLDRARGGREVLHIVSYSAELPTKYKSLLREAAERYAWLILDERTPQNRVGLSVQELIRRNYETGLIYGMYRLDDDDLLSHDYFEQASQYLQSHFVRMVLSLGQGVQAFYSNGEFINPRIEHRPKIAIGLMQISEYNDNGEFITPSDISHTKTDLRNPVIVDSRRISYIHSMHLTQDTDVDLADSALTRRFNKHLKLPKIPSKYDLNEIFPTLPFVEKSGFSI